MAFKISHSSLTDFQRRKIFKDLCLKEKKNFIRQKFGQKGKEIPFYRVDYTTEDIYLPLHYASELFNKPIINRDKKYPRVLPFQMIGTPRDYQNEVIDQSLKNFMTRGTTFLNVFCSFGKTWVAGFFSAIFSQRFGLATLVVFHRIFIRKSWIGTFLNQSTAKIYIIGEDPNPPDPDVQIFLCMDTNMEKISDDIRKKIGHFIVDEIDCFCTRGRIDGLLSLEPMFMTALTATYERDDGFHSMIDMLVGRERIIRISKKPFFVFQKTTPFTVEPKVGKYGVIFDSVVSELDKIEERNGMAIQMVLDNPNEKIIILTKHVEHATNMANWLEHYLKGTNRKVARLYGSIRNYEDASVIVATISKVGVGFDEKEVCLNWGGIRINTLILMSSTKKIEQIAGRVFRAEIPVIIDFVDNNKNVKDHWRYRRRWYESRNGIIHEMPEKLVWKDVQNHLISNYFKRINGQNNVSNQVIQNSSSSILPVQSNDISKKHLANLLAKVQGNEDNRNNKDNRNNLNISKPQDLSSLHAARLMNKLSTMNQNNLNQHHLQPNKQVEQPKQSTSNNKNLSSLHLSRLLEKLN